jgi:hypothetical protein
VDETETDWILATDSVDGAKDEAVWDIPILGAFGKADLSTTGLGGDWSLLQFPLSDGATWSRDIALGFEGDAPTPLEFEATFNPAIQTATGTEPGYDVRAVDAHANLTLEFDYVPAVGWFTRFFAYDTSTQAPDDFIVHAVSMGTGDDWTGTYYLDRAEVAVSHSSATGVNPFGLPPQLIQDGQPTPADFTVASDAQYLYGFVYSFAVEGTHRTALVSPANEARTWEATDTGLQGAESFEFLNEDAQSGPWHVGTAGAGMIVGGGAMLWQVFETTGSM